VTLSTALLFSWACVTAWMDLLQRRVRWWWSLLGLLGAGGYRLAAWARGGIVLEEVLIIFMAVTASYVLWKAVWWGGADAKTAMTLVIAIPDLVFIVVVALVSLLVSALRLVARKGPRSLEQVAVDAVQVVKGGAREGERFPLVAVMAGALPVYLLLELLVA
jgi:Flp pilus assembly protein protease CpaA